MNPEQKFHQLWEYRKKDDEINSSSDDSKSSSDSELDQKRHKEDEEDETENTSRSLQCERLNHPLQKIVEANSMLHSSRTKKVVVVNRSKGNSTKKRKREVSKIEESTQLTDLKTFTESLLKEFKVASNAMLVRMKKQITKLMTAKPASRTKMKESKTPLGSRKRLKATEKRENHEETIAANVMEKRENLSFPEEKPANDSSSCLTVPTTLSRPKSDSLITEFSSSDHTPAGCYNRTNISEKPCFLNDEQSQSHHGYLNSILPDEKFGNFSKMSAKNMGFIEQQRNQTPSSVHPGLQVPVNQWPNNCFSITSQKVLETPGQENSSVGLRMNTGGIRFPGRNFAL